MSSDPFVFDDALNRALADDPVPELSTNFADRVLAATQDRAAPLPRSRSTPSSRWRSGRRLIVGALAAGALGTAAAATGLLEDLPIDIPTPQEIWTSITGAEPEPPPSLPRAEPTADLAPIEDQPVAIKGPIDTPEELEEVFRRVDRVREERRNNRRNMVDQRVDTIIERRREQGLPAPTPEEEAQLRERIDRVRQRADERIGSRIEERRDGLRQEIENGGELTQEDLIGRPRDAGSETPIADRLQRLRQLPPDERRAAIRRWRERQQQRRLDRMQESPAERSDPIAAPSDQVNEEMSEAPAASAATDEPMPSVPDNTNLFYIFCLPAKGFSPLCVLVVSPEEKAGLT